MICTLEGLNNAIARIGIGVLGLMFLVIWLNAYLLRRLNLMEQKIKKLAEIIQKIK